MKYAPMPMLGLAIDFETSGASTKGQHAKRFQALSVGAIVFRFSDFAEIDAYYGEIKFDETRYEWASQAESIHRLSREHLARHGKLMDEVALDLGNLVVNYFATEPVVLLGHNVEFDVEFLQQVMSVIEIELPLARTHLDTASAGAVMLGVYRSNDLFDVLCLEKRGQHNALEDCLMTLESAKRMRAIATAALA